MSIPFLSWAPEISFCITCKGRLHHLQVTLERSITENAILPHVEFVLLDYDSPDGLGEWVRNSMMRFIQQGQLLYARMERRPHFLMAHAKNVAHRLARGRIVCNLDADNFAERGFAQYLINAFHPDVPLFFRPRGRNVAGRIACLKQHFLQAGGYDERFEHGWGWEDADLAYRLERIGLRNFAHNSDGWTCRALKHSDRERGLHTVAGDKQRSAQLHRQFLLRNKRENRRRVNLDRKWGSAVVEVNFCSQHSL